MSPTAYTQTRVLLCSYTKGRVATECADSSALTVPVVTSNYRGKMQGHASVMFNTRHAVLN